MTEIIIDNPIPGTNTPPVLITNQPPVIITNLPPVIPPVIPPITRLDVTTPPAVRLGAPVTAINTGYSPNYPLPTNTTAVYSSGNLGTNRFLTLGNVTNVTVGSTFSTQIDRYNMNTATVETPGLVVDTPIGPIYQAWLSANDGVITNIFGNVVSVTRVTASDPTALLVNGTPAISQTTLLVTTGTSSNLVTQSTLAMPVQTYISGADYSTGTNGTIVDARIPNAIILAGTNLVADLGNIASFEANRSEGSLIRALQASGWINSVAADGTVTDQYDHSSEINTQNKTGILNTFGHANLTDVSFVDASGTTRLQGSIITESVLPLAGASSVTLAGRTIPLNGAIGVTLRELSGGGTNSVISGFLLNYDLQRPINTRLNFIQTRVNP